MTTILLIALALTPAPRVYASPQSPPAAAAIALPAPILAAGDPYGFGPWLNGVRAARGLRPLAYDPALAADCAANSSRGFGHSFLGRARRQNAGVGALNVVCPMWLASPDHASAILDPSCSRYGIAGVNGVWTAGFN